MLAKVLVGGLASIALVYLGLVAFAKSDAAKDWFVMIASRSLETHVTADRLSLTLPGTLVAYDVGVHSIKLTSLTMNLNLWEVLGPTQSVTGRGELSDGWAFDFRFRGSIWTEELRSLSLRMEQWPLPQLLAKLGLQKYLLAPLAEGMVAGFLHKKRQGWEFKGKLQDAAIDLRRIAEGRQLPRAFPERSRVIVAPLHIRFSKRTVKFIKPLELKSRMGTLNIKGGLQHQGSWSWKAMAAVKDAKVARAGYGYLLRCRSLPTSSTFRVSGPVQNPTCGSK